MWLKLNVCGIDINLKINGYATSSKEDWDSQWCQCSFSFSAGNWLNYHRNDNEILLCSEVEELEMYFTKLLNNELLEVKEVSFIEPDFVFILYPQTDRSKSPKYSYLQPKNLLKDIYAEWKVFFWDGGLTDNHLVITLDSDDIKNIRDYLSAIIQNKMKNY